MVDRRQGKPRDRQIGSRLRAIREQRTSLSQEDAAGLLGWSLATQSRIERGQRNITTEEVASILTAYGIPVGEREEIVEEARAVNVSGWWDKALPGVPAEMGTLASYAVDAVSLTDWAVTLIPGLLQTEAYALALIMSDGVSAEDADLRWVARKRRQQILGTLEYTAFICEWALRTPYGGRAAMREQLLHLVSARDRGISVRLMPAGLPYGGLMSHSWLYMTYQTMSPVVNVEVAEGGVYLHDDQAEPYTRRLKLLNDLALSTVETWTTIRSLTKEM